MYKIVIIALCHLSLHRPAKSINIDCSYVTDNYYTLFKVYSCTIKSTSSPENALVSSTGTHSSGRTNDDVIGIYGNIGNIRTFPKGLEIVFRNLKAIYTRSGQIKEIHRDDLKPLPNLVELLLDGNQIEVVEEGLFDYTPNLEAVSFYNNKVYHVNYDAFDSLPKLRFLWTNGSPCYASSSHDRTNTLALIQNLKSSCQNPEISRLEGKLRELRSKSENPSLASTFKELLQKYESDFENINDSKLSYLKNGYQRLKNLGPNTTSSTTEASTTPKQECLDSISEELFALNNKFDNVNAKVDNIGETCGKTNKKIDNFENVMKKLISEALKIEQDKITSTCSNNGTSILEEKIEFYEENLKEFQINVLRKLDAIENEYKITHYKMALTLDQKLKNIENRLFSIKEEFQNN